MPSPRPHPQVSDGEVTLVFERPTGPAWRPSAAVAADLDGAEADKSPEPSADPQPAPDEKKASFWDTL